MRPICWLHVSDIHMRTGEIWSQDVVLQSIYSQTKAQHTTGSVVDFILVTGDLAYSGKAEEYSLVAHFFDNLCEATEVSKERIFCVAGNHDIERERHTLCFEGARAKLLNHNHVDAVLEGGENLESLMKRQENYRNFQNAYFECQDRVPTKEGLGYVSWLTIEDIRFAIVGLDSAWLANGGRDDHGKLIIGERQIINALDLLHQSQESSDIVIAMTHHPFHLLQEFDRQTSMNRVLRACHFFHCGHLHEPEVRVDGTEETRCLSIMAGASYESRHSHNSFSIISLDFNHAQRTVESFQYSPETGLFSSSFSSKFKNEMTPPENISVSELAKILIQYDKSTEPWAHYFSALLLNRKADVLISVNNAPIFAAVEVLQKEEDSDLRRKTLEFMKFRNIFFSLSDRMPPMQILSKHGDAVSCYGKILRDLCEECSDLPNRLCALERDASELIDATPDGSFSHRKNLLEELTNTEEWHLVFPFASRYNDSSAPEMARAANRSLALALAQSDEPQDKEKAKEIYRTLIKGDAAKFDDFGNLSTLLLTMGGSEEAKVVVLTGIERFPRKIDYFFEIAGQIVMYTGDRDFREKLKAIKIERDEDE